MAMNNLQWGQYSSSWVLTALSLSLPISLVHKANLYFFLISFGGYLTEEKKLKLRAERSLVELNFEFTKHDSTETRDQRTI